MILRRWSRSGYSYKEWKGPFWTIEKTPRRMARVRGPDGAAFSEIPSMSRSSSRPSAERLARAEEMNRRSGSQAEAIGRECHAAAGRDRLLRRPARAYARRGSRCAPLLRVAPPTRGRSDVCCCYARGTSGQGARGGRLRGRRARRVDARPSPRATARGCSTTPTSRTVRGSPTGRSRIRSLRDGATWGSLSSIA